MILPGNREVRLPAAADQAIPREWVPLGQQGSSHVGNPLANSLSLSLSVSPCFSQIALTKLSPHTENDSYSLMILANISGFQEEKDGNLKLR